MKLLVLFMLVLADAASTSNKCTVSEWGPWIERTPRNVRTGSVDPLLSHPDPVPRDHVKRSRYAVEEQRTACEAAGTCPRPELRKPEGAMPCTNGLIDGLFPCDRIDQLSFLNFQDLLSTLAKGNNVWGWVDPDTNIEYALMGLTTGVTFVSLEDVNAPVAIAFLPTSSGTSVYRDMKVVNNYAWIVADAYGHGIQGFDMTRLRTIPPGSTVIRDYITYEVENCRSIASNEDLSKIYTVGCTAGVHCADEGGIYIVDVSDPTNPILADNGFNCYDEDLYVHDAQCVVYDGPDLSYNGHDVCFCYNEDTLTIVDVSMPTNIIQISKNSYPGASYTHQGWLTEDHTMILMDDEMDEQFGSGEMKTYVWDIVDLDNPQMVSTHLHGLTTVDHDQYIVGNRTYQADYESGLRILEFDQSTYELTEIAYMDVFPFNNTIAFNGAWDVYPFFDSGHILLSSTDYGLYVVKYNDSVPKSTLKERTRYRTIQHYGDGDCPHLKETDRF